METGRAVAKVALQRGGGVKWSKFAEKGVVIGCGHYIVMSEKCVYFLVLLTRFQRHVLLGIHKRDLLLTY